MRWLLGFDKGQARAGGIPTFPGGEGKRRSVGLDAHVTGGIRAIGGVRQLRYPVLEDLQSVGVGRKAPLVSGDQRRREELYGREVAVGSHLVDSGRRGIVGVKKQQPARLTWIVAVNAHDGAAAAARDATQGHLGILRGGRRNAPHAGSVVTRIDADNSS